MRHPESPSVPALCGELLPFEVNFVSATANAWAHSFLRRLHTELQKNAPQQTRALVVQVARTAHKHFSQHHHPKVGREACLAVGVCSLLVASYRVLWQQLGDRTEARSLTQHCLEGSYRSFVDKVCVPLVRQSANAHLQLTQLNFAHWSAHMFPEIAANDGSGYAAFFERHGVDELTGVLRQADTAWQRAAEKIVRETQTSPEYTFDDRASGFSPFRFAVHSAYKRPDTPPKVMRLVVGLH